ncbi:hypothetical protein AA313_de0209411 [Arthrobotrys entomopaga]|nr:hypothetical protein AA313_de0209411 [Arthrobotrys entomopaga]
MKVSTLVLPILASSLVSAAPAPIVESNKLRRILYRSNLEARAKELYDIALRNNGTRAWGTPGHWETLDWIEGQIPKDYYNVERQYFNISTTVYDELSVAVDGVAATGVNGVSASSGLSSKSITAPMIAIPDLGCEASDYPASVTGKIALVHRGTCNFGLKVALAKTAGAVGVVLWNNQATEVQPSLGAPADYNVTSFIPTVIIPQDQGEALVTKLGTNSLPAKLVTLWHSEEHITANILATTKGGNQNAVITSGCHTDSVKAGPGINDNGSGTIAHIEIAKALTRFSVNNAIRFMWFSAEEDGLLGSEYYTSHLSEAEAAKIVLNLDFDMLASPNYLYSIYDGDGSTFESPFASIGSGHIEKTLMDFLVEDGKTSVPTAFDGRSDYNGFLEIGIPAGGIFMGAEGIKTEAEAKLFGGKAGQPYDACYHQACDTIKNLNYGAWITGAKAIADSIAKYGVSIEGFPFPRPAAKVKPRKIVSDVMVPKPKKGGYIAEV